MMLSIDTKPLRAKRFERISANTIDHHIFAFFTFIELIQLRRVHPSWRDYIDADLVKTGGISCSQSDVCKDIDDPQIATSVTGSDNGDVNGGSSWRRQPYLSSSNPTEASRQMKKRPHDNYVKIAVERQETQTPQEKRPLFDTLTLRTEGDLAILHPKRICSGLGSALRMIWQSPRSASSALTSGSNATASTTVPSGIPKKRMNFLKIVRERSYLLAHRGNRKGDAEYSVISRFLMFDDKWCRIANSVTWDTYFNSFVNVESLTVKKGFFDCPCKFCTTYRSQRATETPTGSSSTQRQPNTSEEGTVELGATRCGDTNGSTTGPAYTSSIAHSGTADEKPPTQYLDLARRHAFDRLCAVFQVMIRNRHSLKHVTIEGVSDDLTFGLVEDKHVPELPIDFTLRSEDGELTTAGTGCNNSLNEVETSQENKPSSGESDAHGSSDHSGNAVSIHPPAPAKRFIFEKLETISFGGTIDCRHIVPLIDFSRLVKLRSLSIGFLESAYISSDPMFGIEPTVVFAPQQIVQNVHLIDATPHLPAIYNGQVDENLAFHGRGMYACTLYTYEGSFDHGFNHGFGCMRASIGETYTGNWKAGRRCGRGVVVQTDGTRMEGTWDADLLEGFGILEKTDGLRYEGYWLHSNFHGWGIFSYKEHLLGFGQFHNGKLHGWAKILQPDTGLWEERWYEMCHSLENDNTYRTRVLYCLPLANCSVVWVSQGNRATCSPRRVAFGEDEEMKHDVFDDLMEDLNDREFLHIPSSMVPNSSAASLPYSRYSTASVAQVASPRTTPTFNLSQPLTSPTSTRSLPSPCASPSISRAHESLPPLFPESPHNGIRLSPNWNGSRHWSRMHNPFLEFAQRLQTTPVSTESSPTPFNHRRTSDESFQMRPRAMLPLSPGSPTDVGQQRAYSRPSSTPTDLTRSSNRRLPRFVQSPSSPRTFERNMNNVTSRRVLADRNLPVHDISPRSPTPTTAGRPSFQRQGAFDATLGMVERSPVSTTGVSPTRLSSSLVAVSSDSQLQSEAYDADHDASISALHFFQRLAGQLQRADQKSENKSPIVRRRFGLKCPKLSRSKLLGDKDLPAILRPSEIDFPPRFVKCLKSYGISHPLTHEIPSNTMRHEGNKPVLFEPIEG